MVVSRKQLEEKSKILEKVEAVATTRVDYEVVRLLKVEVNEFLDKESLMWQQRS